MKQLLGKFAAVALGVSIAVSSSSYAQERLPEIGTAGASVMTIERERIYGDMYMRQLRAMAPLVNDPVLDEYLRDLGSRMVREADGVRFPFNFFWVNQSEINAFAFFGGYVGVHTGLISEARTESELAAVLAHEVAHVSQRHIVRNMERMSNASPTTMAAMLGAVILAVINPQLGMAALTGTMGVSQQMQINYTRQFEQEADRVGLSILARSGFDPMGSPDFFGRLTEKYRYMSRPPEILLTHPYSENRLADMRARAESMPTPVVRDPTSFLLAKYRIEARYIKSLSEVELRRQIDDAESPLIKKAAQYALAIVLLDNRRAEEAETVLAPLLKAEPLNTFYIDVQTDVLLAQSRNDEALALLENAYIRQPNEQTITINFANAAVESKKYELAIALLRDYLQKNEKHVLALDLLGTAYRLNGNISAMHETQAELAALHGAFDQAIDHLHKAHKQSGLELERRRLQARIEQLMSQKQLLQSLNS
ncbi:M48 family metalloprotease [Pseudidiomarina gelatinasegens]|uniref:beta-barrel assembly-enhancing protease n=1 Tax=Pseudidiomarina gelatinasegens TaxID=2487740 RepID=UPI0030EF3609